MKKSIAENKDEFLIRIDSDYKYNLKKQKNNIWYENQKLIRTEKIFEDEYLISFFKCGEDAKTKLYNKLVKGGYANNYNVFNVDIDLLEEANYIEVIEVSNVISPRKIIVFTDEAEKFCARKGIKLDKQYTNKINQHTSYPHTILIDATRKTLEKQLKRNGTVLYEPSDLKFDLTREAYIEGIGRRVEADLVIIVGKSKKKTKILVEVEVGTTDISNFVKKIDKILSIETPLPLLIIVPNIKVIDEVEHKIAKWCERTVLKKADLHYKILSKKQLSKINLKKINYEHIQIG